jgi:hypothetical protein
MEGQAPTPEVTVAPVATPTTTPVAPAPTPQYTPAPQVMEESGVFDGKSRWRMVDIVIMSLFIVLPIYGISYYRKAMKKLDEQPTNQELEDLIDMVNEHDSNLKTALGAKYKNA